MGKQSGVIPFDLRQFRARVLVGDYNEHVVYNKSGRGIRLDVIAGTVLHGPVSLRFELAYDHRFQAQLKSLLAFHRLSEPGLVPAQNCKRSLNVAMALRAFDGKIAGAGLRMIADTLFGEGDWPGDGECRKSRARRMVAKGQKLVAGGPAPILAS